MPRRQFIAFDKHTIFLEDYIKTLPKEEQNDPMRIRVAEMTFPKKRYHTPRFEEMKKQEKIKTFFAKLKGQRSWLWSRDRLLMLMMEDAKLNHAPSEYRIFLSWLSLRLKFTDDEIIGLIKDYLNGKTHYTYSIDGKERIYDTMKRYGYTYCEAIYEQYAEKINFMPTKKIGHWIPDFTFFDRMYWHSTLSEDGKTISFYDPHLDDYNSGLTEEEEEKLVEKIFADFERRKKERMENGEA